MIYFDNASTTEVKEVYIKVIEDILRKFYGNPSNLYRIGERSKNIIETARGRIANVLNCLPEEIFFTSGSSEGNAWALRQRKRILCSAYEHHNIINNIDSIVVGEDYLEKSVEVKRNKTGFIGLGNFRNFLYSHMLVNNETGEIFDVKKQFEFAHELEMITHCDMTQALGNVEFDFKNLGVDIATFSGHKFHCPKGIGFNYFNKDTFTDEEGRSLIHPLIYGGGQEFGVRAGTENVPYIFVLSLAVEDAIKNYAKKLNHCYNLKKLYYNLLKDSGVEYIHVSPANSIESTASICIKNIESEIIMEMLSEKEIYIGTGSACNNGLMEVDSVLSAMDISKEYIHGLIRISFSLENTQEEVVEFVKELKECCKELGILKEE